MIAVDAMGGDYAPRETVLGAVRAAKRGVKSILFGDENRILPLLNEQSFDQSLIQVVHCADSIAMGAVPTVGILNQKESSLVQALYAVEGGQADALVTAGNSGAALIGGTLILGKVPGLLRPAIGEFLPTVEGRFFCLDLGANVDCRPDYLYQFAWMGHLYASLVGGIRNPRVALLSNGSEPYKGSLAVKEAYRLLRESTGLCFVGNIEPRDLFESSVDVLVCDGFAGNILLKTVQGTVRFGWQWMKNRAERFSWWQRLLLYGYKNVLSEIREKSDYERVGASLLLGLKKPLFVAHGCSRSLAIEAALVRAHQLVQNRVVDRFNNKLTSLLVEDRNLIDSGFFSTRSALSATLDGMK